MKRHAVCYIFLWYDFQRFTCATCYQPTKIKRGSFVKMGINCGKVVCRHVYNAPPMKHLISEKRRETHTKSERERERELRKWKRKKPNET